MIVMHIYGIVTVYCIISIGDNKIFICIHMQN